MNGRRKPRTGSSISNGHDVRIIECWELLIVEKAIECMLYPMHASIIGYQVARKYAEKYDPHFGTGLIPKSAPMVEEIAEFWGLHYLGRGWKKKVGLLP